MIFFVFLVADQPGHPRGVVYVELGQRRIPVQFAKRVVGRRMYGGQSTYIPLKVNQAGVIPIIFASSVLLLPVLITNFLGNSTEGWRRSLTQFVNKYIVNSQNLVYILLFYGAMIIGFAYFYNSIAFDPVKPGRPDPQAGWLHPRHPPRPPDRALPVEGRQPHHAAGRRVHRRHRHPAVHRAVRWATCSSFPFAGTTVLIAVGVALETHAQIDSQLMLRNYEGFLK